MQDWDNLRFFLALAQTGSISAAAEKLNVNQTTVSRRINSFEQALEVRLFERLNTGFELTVEGEELMQRAQRIEHETFAIDRLLMGKNLELCGSIRVTTTLLVAKYFMVPIVKRFNQQYPDIEIDFDLSNNNYDLAAREADVAIRVTREAVPESLIGRELGVIEFAVYGEKSYIESIRHNTAAQCLRWIGEDNSQPRPSWLPASLTNLQLVMRTNDVMASLELLRQGLGVGRLPCVVGDAEENLRRLPLQHSLPAAPVWLLTHADLRRVNRIRVFTAFVADEIRRQLGAQSSLLAK